MANCHCPAYHYPHRPGGGRCGAVSHEHNPTVANPSQRELMSLAIVGGIVLLVLRARSMAAQMPVVQPTPGTTGH